MKKYTIEKLQNLNKEELLYIAKAMVIGKLSEGEVSAGLKHSLILMAAAFFIISLAQGAV